MKNPLLAAGETSAFKLIASLIFYAFYAAVLGLCLVPPAAFIGWAWASIMAPAGAAPAGSLVLFCLCMGASLYIYLISAVVVMGLVVRLLTLGLKPGRYPQVSMTMLRWLFYSGVYALAYKLVLSLIPMSFFLNLFFQIVGCKLGKRVYLNSHGLNDAYLIEIGDDVTVGGGAEISCHLFENGFLILDRVKIGAGSLIGANCYISPGVEIGRKAVIGLGSYIRRGKKIPDGACYTRIASLPMHDAARLEKQSRKAPS